MRVVSPRSLLGQKKLFRSVKANDTGAGKNRGVPSFSKCCLWRPIFISSGTVWFKEKHNVSQHQLHIFYMRNSENILTDSEIVKCTAFVL